MIGDTYCIGALIRPDIRHFNCNRALIYPSQTPKQKEAVYKSTIFHSFNPPPFLPRLPAPAYQKKVRLNRLVISSNNTISKKKSRNKPPEELQFRISKRIPGCAAHNRNGKKKVKRGRVAVRMGRIKKIYEWIDESGGCQEIYIYIGLKNV